MADDKFATSSTLGGFVELGKYFQLVSIVPAAVVVGTGYGLIAAGAPGERPRWSALAEAVDGLSLAGISALGLLVILVAMVVHPFQLASTRALEGYWGTSDLARTAMQSRASIHLRRRRQLAARLVKARKMHANLYQPYHESDLEEERQLEPRILQAIITKQEHERALQHYPHEPLRTLPTRLGNTLRYYEDLPTARYRFDVIAYLPHLLERAPAQQVERLDDTRIDLDLSVRFTICWLLAAVLSFVLLLPYDIWMVVPITAYALAWISYRGAVHAAGSYGRTLLMVVELNRQLVSEFHPD